MDISNGIDEILLRNWTRDPECLTELNAILCPSAFDLPIDTIDKLIFETTNGRPLTNEQNKGKKAA